MRDLHLLRRFEPVVRYTRGERFFPMDVEHYLASCSLWVERPGQEPVRLIPEGRLDGERLCELGLEPSGSVHFLKLSDAADLRRLKSRRAGPVQRGVDDGFRAGLGRLARVGYMSRFVDALFSLSLLARGRVPGDAADAAAIAYDLLLAERESYRYYGRVLRVGGWTVLQYWFFYAYNNWRSGFFGANDHEGDWEMISIYLSGDHAGRLRPEWVAFASHDFSGDDLRRRWDDPEVEKVGERPVVYAAAGSHASYFAPGDYITEIELPLPLPLLRVGATFQRFWLRVRGLSGGNGSRPDGERPGLFHIPFIDYARGDGLSIGPGGDREWSRPHLLDPPSTWTVGYRGLWGFYARDAFAGENGPGGPMFNRDGSVRRAWHDPLGWVGLDKVLPRGELLAGVAAQRDAVRARMEADRAEAEEKALRLTSLNLEASAARGRPYMKRLEGARRREIAALSQQLGELRQRLAEDAGLLDALKDYWERLRSGEAGPARAHLRRPHRPASAAERRMSGLAELWAAISMGLLLIGFVALALFARAYLTFGLVVILSAFVVIESGFRKRITELLTNVTVGLALAASLVLLYDFFWEIVTLAVVAGGLYIMWENLRELWT